MTQHRKDCQGHHLLEVTCEQAIALREKAQLDPFHCQYSPLGYHGFTTLSRCCCYRPCTVTRESLLAAAIDMG